MSHRRSFIKQTAFLGLSTTFATAAVEALASGNSPENLRDQKQSDLTFLFQGDSITDGNHGRAEWDLNHIMGHGFACNIAGRLGAEFPERHLKFINRGISGNKITDLAARWQQDTLDLKPDVLNILVGINDSDSYLKDKTNGVSVKIYEETYRNLLDQTKAKFPDIVFVLCEPFTLPYSYEENTRTERQRDVTERAAVVKKLSQEYQAIFVPFQDVFDQAKKRAPEQYWIWDHIHPTVAGHELMTRAWLNQVRKRFKFIKSI